MDTYRTVTVTRDTPSGIVTDEYELLVRRLDPNDLAVGRERELPVPPGVILCVADGGEHFVELQVADLIDLRLGEIK